MIHLTFDVWRGKLSHYLGFLNDLDEAITALYNAHRRDQHFAQSQLG